MKNLKTIGIVAGVIVLLAIGFFIGIRRQQSLTGKVAGEIVAVGSDYEDGTTRTGKDKTARVTKILYRYQVDGKAVEAEMIDRSNINNYRVGAQGTVCFDPKKPQISDFHTGDYKCG